MKKFCSLLLVMSVFTVVIFAQPLINSPSKKEFPAVKGIRFKKVFPKKIKLSSFNNKKNNKPSIVSRWYDYALAMQNNNFPNGNDSNLNIDYLFPDTTILAKYSNSAFTPYFHSIGVVLDPTDYIFQNDTLLNITSKFLNYTIDSVKIHGVYGRCINNAAIIDTLEVEVISNITQPINYLILKTG